MRLNRVLDGRRTRSSDQNRGMVYYWRGDFGRAAATLEAACRALKRHGDRVAEVRTRVTLGRSAWTGRRLSVCRASSREAIKVADDLGQTLLVAAAHHNLGYLSMLQRDLPRAIGEFEAPSPAMSRRARMATCRRSTQTTPRHSPTRPVRRRRGACAAEPSRCSKDGNEIEMAGALVTAAEIVSLSATTLGRGQPPMKRLAGTASRDETGGWRSRRAWPCRPRRVRTSRRSSSPTNSTRSLIASMTDGLGAEATRSRLVGCARSGRGDAELSSGPRPCRHASASPQRPCGGPHPARPRRRRRRAEAGRSGSGTAGDQPWPECGDVEPSRHSGHSKRGPMQPSTATRSTEIGARIAVSDGRPRELLARIEATRLMAARTPSLRPPADPEIARLLAELRSTEVTLADSSVSDDDRRVAESAHARLERDIRRRSRSARADPSARIAVRREIDSALALLEDRQLLAHARLDGRLYAVSVIGGRARLHDLGRSTTSTSGSRR